MALSARVIFSASTNYADVNLPELVSAEIMPDGDSIQIVFSKAVTFGGGGNGGFVLDTDGDAVTPTYDSGDGTTTLVYALSRTVLGAETVTDFDYTQPGDGIVDLSDRELASFSNQQGEVTNSSGESGVSYGLVETFEGSNADTQGITGYDNTGWTSSNSANDPQYATSPAPLAGSHSLRITNGARYVRRTVSNFGAMASAYVIYRNQTFQANVAILSILDSSNNAIALIRTFSTNFVKIEIGATISSSASISTSAEVHVWFEYEKGTGADAVARLYMASTATKPGSPSLTITTGASTADANRIQLNSASITLWDNLVCSDDPIGSDPV